MVPEIQSETDRIVCHFGPFLPFYPANNPQNQKFKKMKKNTWRYYHLQMCTINDNYMMYGSCDMERDGHNFLSFWTVFCPFTSLTTQKIKKI